MKRVSILVTIITMFVFVLTAQAGEKEGDYFVGKWKLLVEGTPNGDSEMLVTFERNEKGEMIGTSGDAAGETPAVKFNRVEVTDDSVTAYWVAQGYDVYIFLEKIDDNSVEGSLMDMFDASGSRVVEE
ncbi:hypothetical protein [Plebeiibacterium marinum]|uniref:Uncharacterized protein n=1 Tax=Plebeiibacterium marinum TaxID=2992111 RepID=A0AAE3MGM0_9BACT|nr:hypothetical protein [Plebeiobacterium marinum]MCW3807356.1 hypothetical protein [Plebeiobacterium marinum]